jgi:hypothetical protein
MATLTDAFLADLDDLSDGDNELEEQKEDDIIDEVSFVLHFVPISALSPTSASHCHLHVSVPAIYVPDVQANELRCQASIEHVPSPCWSGNVAV